jgi:hypothetical protein
MYTCGPTFYAYQHIGHVRSHYNAVSLHTSLGSAPPIERQLHYARRDLLAV